MPWLPIPLPVLLLPSPFPLALQAIPPVRFPLMMDSSSFGVCGCGMSGSVSCSGLASLPTSTLTITAISNPPKDAFHKRNGLYNAPGTPSTPLQINCLPTRVEKVGELVDTKGPQFFRRLFMLEQGNDIVCQGRRVSVASTTGMSGGARSRALYMAVRRLTR